MIIKEYAEDLQHADKWLTYLGFCLSMVTVIVTGEFETKNSRFLLAGSEWRLIFIVIAAYSGIQTIRQLVKRYHRRSIDDLLGEIVKRSEYRYEDRAIFLIKTYDAGSGFRILTFRDPLWKCYFLPHANLERVQPSHVDDQDLCSEIASFLGLEVDSVSLRYVDDLDLWSRKHSRYHDRETDYRFRFFLLQFRETTSIPSHLSNANFTFSGRTYSWMTITEMEADKNTWKQNKDMTRHLLDNRRHLLRDTPHSVPQGFVQVRTNEN